MEATMMSLFADSSRYVDAFHLFVKSSNEHQLMQEFVDTKLPELISSMGLKKQGIEVLGVGSGAGEIDLQMISLIQAVYPGVRINNNIVEPSAKQISCYKERIAKTKGLDNVTFSWHEKTSHEFESEIKESKQLKKYDFIHMIQMLYYVKDVEATIKFFSSCLAPKGKLIISLVSEKSGWPILWQKYGSRLPLNDLCFQVTSGGVQDILNSMGAKYESYNLHSHTNITECFVEGDHNGELLLDFLTDTCEFNKNAPSDLRDQVLHDLKSLEFSASKDGKILFRNKASVIVVESP
uniref:Histamine N-methyltransferase n=1 Tax=Leptobrachium leishanense TaxID=445787 RepID=A0A8C5ME15_9ANUR